MSTANILVAVAIYMHYLYGMSRIEAEKQEIKKAVEIGKRNKQIIPQVKNWCRNLEITDKSAGMIAEYYRVPTMLYISCPHTTNSIGGMDFEGVARQFIAECCFSCEKRNSITEKNFGQDLFETHKREEEAQRLEAEERILKHSEIRDAIDQLAEKETTEGNITTLSILRLVQQLGSVAEESVEELKEKLLQASKVSPDFFSNAAIDYLTLFACENSDEKLLETLCNIATHKPQLTEFAKARINEVVSKTSSDVLFGIFDEITENLIEDRTLTVLSQVVDLLYYGRHIGEPYGLRQYPKAVQLFFRLRSQSQERFEDILREKLKLEGKSQRLNIYGFLEALMDVEADVCIAFIPDLIKSYDFEEDKYGESADGKASELLHKLYVSYPQKVIDALNILYPKASDGAKISIFDFFRETIVEDVKEGRIAEPFMVDTLTNEYFHSRSKEIKKEALHDIRYTVGDAGSAFAEKFDTFLGEFINTCKQRHRHDMHVEEIEKYGAMATTFNPLVGKSGIDIWGIKVDLDSRINDLDSVLTFIGKSTEQKAADTLISTIRGLSSRADGSVKANLIKLLRQITQDNLILGALLPDIHTWLFDTDSQAVRMEAVRFVERIFEKHTLLVTRTLIDLVKVFLHDPEKGVCHTALKAYSLLIEKFPEEVDQPDIEQIIRLLGNSYVVIHKAAIDLSHDIYPFLNAKQRQVWIITLLGWEETYFKEPDFRYCKDVVRKLLFATRELPEWYKFVTEQVMPKYADVNDFYAAQDGLEALTELRGSSKTLTQIWIEKSLSFLTRYIEDDFDRNPEYSFRNRLLNAYYELTPEQFTQAYPLFDSAIEKLIDKKDNRTALALAGILGYYRRNDGMLTSLKKFDQEAMKLKANEVLKTVTEIFYALASREHTVVTKN